MADHLCLNDAEAPWLLLQLQAPAQNKESCLLKMPAARWHEDPLMRLETEAFTLDSDMRLHPANYIKSMWRVTQTGPRPY